MKTDVINNFNGNSNSKATSYDDVWKNFQTKYGEKPKKAREFKKKLDKDDFLKIMITQMKHQDPSKPFDMDKMAAQMAQMTSVEQMKNMNTTLEKVLDQNKPLERLAMSNMIGKMVTVDSSRFEHTEGQGEVLNFNLPQSAEDVKVSLISQDGKKALEKSIGSQNAGMNTFQWDGVMDNTLPAKSGPYWIQVEAKDKYGAPIAVNTQIKLPVIGVNLSKADPQLLIGNGSKYQSVSMKQVVQVEQGSEGLPQSASQPLVNPSSGAPIFSFTKGVGSQPLSLKTMDPLAKKAIAQFKKQEAASPVRAQEVKKSAEPPKPKGEIAPMKFPNGLGEYNKGKEVTENEQ